MILQLYLLQQENIVMYNLRQTSSTSFTEKFELTELHLSIYSI